MPNYTYKARTQDGQMIQAVMEAESEQQVREALRRNNLTPTVINSPKTGISREIKLPQSNKVPGKELAVFSRQLSTLLGAGVAIVQALDILKDQTSHPKMKEIISAIILEVSAGTPLSEAMSRHRAFSPLYLNLIRAGETSGKMGHVAGELATFLEKEVALNGKLKSAMTYPISVLIIALLITYFLLTKIVPQFASILTEIGGKLPPLTLAVIAVANFLQTKGPFIGILIILMVIGFKQIQKTPNGAMAIDRIKMRLPVIGKLLKSGAVARLTRTMSLLTEAGVILHESLGIAKNVSGLLPVSAAVANAQRAVISGMPMSAAMSAQPDIFPKMMVSMTAIGEETGKISSMMEKVAEFYEREVDQMIEQMTSLIEPIMIVFLGTVVGTIVAAMFMPMFSVINQLSG